MIEIALGEPYPLTGDVRIRFEGEGLARFRIEHGRDRITWYPVLQTPANRKEAMFWQALADNDPTVPVDRITGDCEVIYHRATKGLAADWLQIVAGDAGEEALVQCRAYRIAIEPLYAAG